MILNVGDILIPKSKCTMEDGSGDALILNKEYIVKFINENDEIYIDSETDVDHIFHTDIDSTYYYGLFFKIK